MRLDCACGRTYRAPDHDCPACGHTLVPRPDDLSRRAVPPAAAKVDPVVLVKQKLALRDELRVRDRQLRQAELRIKALQAQLDRLHDRGQEVRIAASPLKVIDARIEPVELPDDRLPVLDLDGD
jgi:hypothetical protein